MHVIRLKLFDMKRTILLLQLLLIPILLKANYSVEIDDINYYLDDSNKTAEVRRGESNYSGTIIIPSQVSFGDVIYTVTSIDGYAFSDCSELVAIDIPNSVISIGNYAFSNCTGLISISIPNSITVIGNNTFYNTGWYNNQPDGIVYLGNWVYNYKGTMSIDTCLVLKNGVVGIADYAFAYRYELKSIVIPDDVTSIGNSAFYGCTGLTSIEFPNSVTSIGQFAFESCYRLTSIVIPNGATSIGFRAFGNCTGLISVDIPNGLTSIRSQAFANTGWYNNQPDGIVYLGNWVYKYKGTMPHNTHIELKEGTLGFVSNAFSGCTGLYSIVIPETVASIGSDVFSGCDSLSLVTINSDKIVSSDYGEDGWLYGYPVGLGVIFGKQVRKYIIGNDVTRIGANAFNRCTGLTFIEIPNGVTSIGDNAFYGCTNMLSIDIPNSVTSIGENAFSCCDSLREVTINSNAIVSTNYHDDGEWYIIGDEDESRFGLGSIFGKQVNKYVLGSNVTKIGNNAFNNCRRLTTIEIPESVRSIGDSAFYGCRNLDCISIPSRVISIGNATFYGCENIKSLILPKCVTWIGDYAFGNCCRLSYFTIPDSVAYIGNNAFSSCYSLEMIKCYPSVPPQGDFFRSLGNVIFLVPEKSLSEYDNCYWYNSRVKMKAAGTEIGGVSYTLDKNLLTAQVSPGFLSYSGSIFIPTEVTYENHIFTTVGIDERSFWKCNDITSITIPNGVLFIGDYAFEECTSLTSVRIPESLTSIGEYCFSDCSSLSSINIPDGVTYIGHAAFIDCNNVDSINIPGSLMRISNYCFYGCSGLKSITIPESVTSIDYGAFDGCKLETVFAKNPSTQLESAFSVRTFQHAMLYIPEGTWREAIYGGDWYQFNNIREITSTKQSLVPSRAYTMMNIQTSEYAVYNQAGNEVEIAHAFYSIDEEDPNSCWQIIDDARGVSIMNIGSQKYLSVAAGGALSLSSNRVALDVTDTENGMTINDGSQEWVFVTNNSVAAIDNPTSVELRVADDTDVSAKGYYSIDGKQLSEPQRGLNLLQNKNGRVKKVLVK